MESTNKIYQTAVGENLLEALRDNYWDTLTGISAMISAVKMAIDAAPGEAEKAEFEKKLRDLNAAHEAVSGAAELVSDRTI